MTQKDVYDLLSSFGVSVGFNRIKKGTSLPFITYHISQPNNFVADSVVYYEVLNVEFRVYEGEQINPQLHKTIREKLKENGIPWTSDTTTVEDEQLTITYYYFGGIN